MTKFLNLATLPPELLQILSSNSTTTMAVENDSGLIVEGSRNSRLASLAGSMRRRGQSAESIEAALLVENSTRCDPPLSDSEVSKIARSISRYPPTSGPGVQIATYVENKNKAPDLDNAHRFVDENLSEIRYCEELGGWLLWDGCRWAPDRTRKIFELAKKSIDDELNKAIESSDDDYAKEMVRVRQAPRIKALIELARTDQRIATTADVFNRDRHLLNCRNATVDLRDGSQKKPDRKDLITQVTSVAYEPNATSVVLSKFLGDITGNDQVYANFLKRLAGYFATGDTSAEILPFIYGPPQTGKSTFVEFLKRVLGDYAKTADFTTWLDNSHGTAGGPRGDIARLDGARLVVSVEVKEGSDLAVGLLKQVTGGDKMVARHMYSREFEFHPMFKIVLVANDPPRISNEDEAMWRRVLRVPFNHAPAVPDPSLKRDLLDQKLSGEAELAWIVQGAVEFYEHGLAIPATVADSTESYRVEMDQLGQFFRERLMFDPDKQIMRAVLAEIYEAWCDEVGEKPLSRQKLYRRIVEQGGVSFKTSGHLGFSGVGLGLR